jgi:NodT family efflux transporter outer membrane factor (OMF) lipoprotein
MALRRHASVAALLLLGGCTVGPDYRPPAVALPASYGADAAAAPGNADLGQWWRAFGDPMLNALIERARSGNLDVRQAAARVEEARAQERVVRARGGPALNAGAQAGYTRLSNNALPAGLANLGGGGGQSGAGSPIGLPGEDFATFQTGFDASWEIDLFGGQRRAREAAAARTEAALWSQRDAEVMLAAEVARTYLQVRSLKRRIALADATLAAKHQALDFIETRARHGLVNSVDARRQQQEIERTAAAREDLLAQINAHIHALGTLLGLAPTALDVELSRAPAGPPSAIEIPVGLPSELLRRRPDVRAAERRLAAATADIGVATADLYPKHSLTGALQLVSRSLAALLESDSLFANAAGRVSAPLLGGAGRATVALRRTQANGALIAYEGAVMSSLRDVEDALTRLDADRQKVVVLRRSVEAARDAAGTAEVRQRNGLVPMADVLQARQSWLADQDALTQAEAAAAQDEVALYKALGGGWDDRRGNDEETARGRGS